MLSCLHRAEPMKKKKKPDAVKSMATILRKKKRIEKEIKRISKFGRQLKPIEEIETDRVLIKELVQRKRPSIDVSENEHDQRALLIKEWSRYRHVEALEESKKLCRLMRAQRRALSLLHSTSPSLYMAAIQLSVPNSELESIAELNSEIGLSSTLTNLPFHSVSGPYVSPPLATESDTQSDAQPLYEAPDGEWVDVTPIFHYDFELDKRFLSMPVKKKLGFGPSSTPKVSSISLARGITDAEVAALTQDVLKDNSDNED